MADFNPHYLRPRKPQTLAVDRICWKSQKLKNRLSSVGSRYLLQQEFSPSIGSEWRCSNIDRQASPSQEELLFWLTYSRIERLSSPLFAMFLDITCEQRGKFLVKVGKSSLSTVTFCKAMKYACESVDKLSLNSESSLEFVPSCELE